MADTSVKITDETRDALRRLADAAGLTIKEYLEQVAEEKEQEQALETATAAFRRFINTPGLMERFDEDFGGLPPVRSDSRAA